MTKYCKCVRSSSLSSVDQRTRIMVAQRHRESSESITYDRLSDAGTKNNPRGFAHKDPRCEHLVLNSHLPGNLFCETSIDHLSLGCQVSSNKLVGGNSAPVYGLENLTARIWAHWTRLPCTAEQ